MWLLVCLPPPPWPLRWIIPQLTKKKKLVPLLFFLTWLRMPRVPLGYGTKVCGYQSTMHSGHNVVLHCNNIVKCIHLKCCCCFFRFLANVRSDVDGQPQLIPSLDLWRRKKEKKSTVVKKKIYPGLQTQSSHPKKKSPLPNAFQVRWWIALAQSPNE